MSLGVMAVALLVGKVGVGSIVADVECAGFSARWPAFVNPALPPPENPENSVKLLFLHFML